MVVVNHYSKELIAKIVYYGPGLCGKTTNLQFLHDGIAERVRGRLLSLATKTDRTLYFDFLPMDIGTVGGMEARVQLYTVPGQIYYNETRKLVLKGADGIVFVADSQADLFDANVDSLRNLEQNLEAHRTTLARTPHVLQFNKRDLSPLSRVAELNGALNKYGAPHFEAVATTGAGVEETLNAVMRLVLERLAKPGGASEPRSRRSAEAV